MAKKNGILIDVGQDSSESTTPHQAETPTPDASFPNLRPGIIQALAAASIIGFSSAAYAEDTHNHRAETKHAFSIGTEAMIGKHPAYGMEAAYSILPSFDHSRTVNLVVTPVDFMVMQKHLLAEHSHATSLSTRPQYFVGGMAGINTQINKHLEIETEIGGGVGFVPYFHMEGGVPGQLKYQPTPIAKMDLKLIYFPTHHFNIFTGYSPEVTLTPVPHTIKGEEIEKTYHFTHGLTAGIGAEF